MAFLCLVSQPFASFSASVLSTFLMAGTKPRAATIVWASINRLEPVNDVLGFACSGRVGAERVSCRPMADVDIQMMALFGSARIRSEQEFRNLIDSAGLSTIRIIPTAAPISLIEVAIKPDA